MTIEHEFYNIFNINKQYSDAICISFTTASNIYTTIGDPPKLTRGVELNYPPITHEVILKLITVLNRCLSQGLGTYSLVAGKTIDEIKECVLKDCIKDNGQIYNDVREIFYGK